ncbi:glutathione-independent formaldehyde dehydrogenase [Diaporthe amygdali]|uniref:glutathione-independent formaldehyde dehydrogenase n=1 Tax=Phomopsis amygdali TaxID=1214568 RepID=UPI0022FF2CA9|nr:glutathione-independent formaldehyde dehydrogenase [Diaporthe amygdali]KAJ0106812.1 glutathione-independent formaldehyde dehydrogenase [Diaporthe amygdali]
MSATMKAVNYSGPFKVTVQDVEAPRIEHPDDVIVKVTTSAICGSDLHMYEGRTGAQPGITFGHENMGIVEEVGSGVTLLEKGDRVVMPFNVADGRCRNCEEGKTAFCTGVNPGFAGGAYGYVAMGPYRGGQAQYLRVPYADFNALKLPPGTEHEADFILLADIFPTGWHGVTLSGFQPGESVAVFGGGPVGLMAAYSAVLRGASRVFLVDRVKERLDAASKIGAEAVSFEEFDPVERIIELNGGMVDRSVDAVGYQAVSKGGSSEVPNIVLENMIKVTRPCGGLGIPGLYVPTDPGAPDKAAGEGMISLSFGKLFEKGLSLATGQCNVKAYNRYLRDLIIAGKAKPSFVVSHEIDIDEAPTAYEKFDKRIEGYTKVLIHPNGPIASTGGDSSKGAAVWGEGGKGIRSVEKTIKSWV